MSTLLPFASNALTTYVYEPFSYTIANPPVGTSTLTLSNVSSGIPPGYLTVNSPTDVLFATTSNAMTGGTTASFNVVAKDSGGTTLATSSNIVTVKSGRFLDAPGGNGYEGAIFSFFKSEPIAPIPLVVPFGIATPTTVPTLPPGLTYTSNDSNSYSITGTPLAVVPQSNYLIIGKGTGSNLGKIVTSTIGISVGGERIQMNLNGSPIVSLMVVDTAISPRILTSAFPPYPSGGTLRYSWSGLPDGITVTDSSGNTKTSPFTPFDASATLIIQGAPTITAANAFRDAGGSASNVVTFTATRTNPLPQLSNTLPITFSFGETVLFNTPSVPPLYSGVTLDPSAVSFYAKTYFANTGSAISNIFSPDLRSDLSLNFVAGTGLAYLTGTPGATGTTSYTIRAINSNAVSRDLSVPITVDADSVSFESPPTPAVDICYNFVISRPSSLALTGYYPSNIQFQASAASRKPVTFSASGLAGTGLSLSNVSSNTVQLVGTPDTVTALTTATITASAVGTPATASRTFKIAVLNDVITFSQPSTSALSFIQNRAITPIQLTATTLSERSVISFASANLPSGLSISPTGLISGTPFVDVSGSFTVTASTGYMSQNRVYSYNLTPDSIVLIERPQPSYVLTLGGPIPPAKVSGLSYSGIVVSNFVFNSLPITYGLTLDASTGIFGGTFTTSFPPDAVLPSNVVFSVQGSAGTLTSSLPVQLNTSNAPRYRWYALKGNVLVNTISTLDNWSEVFEDDGSGPSAIPSGFLDYSIRQVDINALAMIVSTNTNLMFYSSNGTDFSSVFLDPASWPEPTPSTISGFYYVGPYTLARDGTTVYGVGYYTGGGDVGDATGFFKSEDDGQTWTTTFPLIASGEPGLSAVPGAFVRGSAIAYKNNVLLLGSDIGIAGLQPPTVRSTDGGSTWAAVTTSLVKWVITFNVDATRWIMIGSDGYYPTDDPYTAATRTIRYSDDSGETWSLVTSGDFNYVADFIVYGNGTWIAGGRQYQSMDGYFYYEFRSSTDGLVWTSFTLPTTVYPTTLVFIPAEDESRATLLDTILYDGQNFIILLRLWTNNGSSDSYFPRAYYHAADGSSLSTGWTQVSMNSLVDIGAYSAGPKRLKGRFPVATDPLEPILLFPDQTGTGPTVTSPTNTSFLFYQYVQITPITFSATGTGRIYFFVQDAELPRGITFNSVTNTLSGIPALTGDSSLTIYVKDDVGVTLLNVTIRVIIASVTRQQTSAGAWTSLVRQYTIVNAAQNSVNGKTLPATEPPLGEFMRPQPPDSVSAPGDPNCVKKC